MTDKADICGSARRHMAERKKAGKSANTSELLGRLFKTKNIARFLSSNEEALLLTPFSEYICALCEKRGETPGQIIRRADLDVSFGHQIFKGTKNPSRDKVIQLAFGFGCDVAGAQELLQHARLSQLYPKVRRDAAIIYCLHNEISLTDTQLVLYKLGLAEFGGEKK